MYFHQRLSIALLLNLGMASLALANTSTYYCSFGKGAGYINAGDSMQKVQATCGAPDDTYEQPSSMIQTQQVEIWVYTASPLLGGPNARPPVTIVNGHPPTPAPYNQPQVPSVSFQVINGKVANIAGQTQGQVSQWRCPSGGSIQVGTTSQELMSACGQPAMVNQSTQQVTVQPKTVTYWRYGSASSQYGQKPVVLTFQNGMLVGIQ